MSPDVHGASRSARLVTALARRVEHQPVMTTLLVALVLRSSLAVALSVRGTSLFIDEDGYLALTGAATDGDARALFQGPSDSYYWNLRGFTVPLRALFSVFGSSYLVGRLWAVVLGAMTAALTAALARRLVEPRRAALAGLLVAVLPSQVVLSSVVLRESSVWVALLVLATCISVVSVASGRTLLLVALTSMGSLLWLWWTRPQTALVATGAALLAVVVHLARRRRIAVLVCAATIGLVAPLAAGGGVGGLRFATTNLQRLDVIRSNMAVGAESAIDERPLSYRPPRTAEIHMESTLRKAFDRLPRGLAAELVRPYPWETPTSQQSRASQLENLLWVPLYLAAAAGALRLRRQGPVIGFVVLLVGGLVVLAAVSQGNLGTAFRHRGQILWGLALLAAAAPLPRRRSAATTGSSD